MIAAKETLMTDGYKETRDALAGKERLRAPFCWFGGKGHMLSKLLPLIPAAGRPYCEPYAGAASVFWSRDPAPVEVLNDLDDRIINLIKEGLGVAYGG